MANKPPKDESPEGDEGLPPIEDVEKALVKAAETGHATTGSLKAKLTAAEAAFHSELGGKETAASKALIDAANSMPGFEFIPGTDKGSTYLVIAKAKGLKLAIKPLMVPGAVDTPKGKRAVLLIGARLRVVVADPSGSLLLANKTFNLKLENRGMHWSGHAVLPVCFLPASPFEAFTFFTENKLLDKFTAEIINRVGAENMVVPAETLADYLDQEFSKGLSAVPSVSPPGDLMVF